MVVVQSSKLGVTVDKANISPGVLILCICPEYSRCVTISQQRHHPHLNKKHSIKQIRVINFSRARHTRNPNPSISTLLSDSQRTGNKIDIIRPNKSTNPPTIPKTSHTRLASNKGKEMTSRKENQPSIPPIQQKKSRTNTHPTILNTNRKAKNPPRSRSKVMKP